MIEKSRSTPTEWVDPDDAPELTAEFFEKAIPMIGERVVTPEEFAREARKDGGAMNSANKVPVTVFYDAEVVAAFESTGQGWQQRMNEALRDWLKTNLPR
jgi:uncharacterized protein (DUF4415 family)